MKVSVFYEPICAKHGSTRLRLTRCSAISVYIKDYKVILSKSLICIAQTATCLWHMHIRTGSVVTNHISVLSGYWALGIQFSQYSTAHKYLESERSRWKKEWEQLSLVTTLLRFVPIYPTSKATNGQLQTHTKGKRQTHKPDRVRFTDVGFGSRLGQLVDQLESVHGCWFGRDVLISITSGICSRNVVQVYLLQVLFYMSERRVSSQGLDFTFVH
jgi:hypothetical protein